MRANRIATPVALGLVAVLVAACGGSSATNSGGGKPLENATLTIAVDQDPGNLDPQNSVLIVDGEFAAFAYDPLVNEGPKGDVVSGLAQTWHQSGTTYQFALRPGITCSDGTPLTASTVAANFNYLANPASKSPLLGLYVPAGLKASGNDATHTVTLRLSSPFAFFLIGLSAVPIVCQKALASRKGIAEATDGTGPYQLTSYVSGDSYTYTVRKGYAWGPGGASTSVAGLPAKVVLKVVSNASTSANLLLAGTVNITGVSQADQPRVDAAHLMHRGIQAPVGEMFYNEAADRPAADPKVRRALTAALDLNQIGKVMTGGTGQPSQGMVTVEPKPCSGNTVAGLLPAHDVATAEQLLDQAGWAKGSDGVRRKNGKPLSLQLIYGNTPDTTASAAELAVSQWRAAGVKVKAVAVTDTQLSSTLFGTGSWDISWAPLTVQLPTQLVPLLSGAVPPKGTNFAHISNAIYDKLSAAASSMADTSGCANWTTAEKALIQAVDVVPYYDSVGPTYAKNATFDDIGGVLVPTSLRRLG
jgi:peptide/nickel transport system substrate-binding protein